MGKYELLRPVGAGGMGEVFLAQEHGPAGLKRWVAVKRVLRHLLSDRQVTEMFLREARIAAQLNHPNIVHLIELGEEEGAFFLVMEYVHGRSVRELTHLPGDGPLPVPCAVSVITQALKGLSYAHTLQGLNGQFTPVIHRDISPDNLLVSFEGTVKVLDFGIAKINSGSALTGQAVVRGKFAYMAPEQFRSEPVSARTDIYSAGVVLYELLGGTRPIQGESDASLMHGVLHGDITPLNQRVPSLNPQLAAVVHRAMSREPDARFETASQMIDALRPFEGEGGEEGARRALGDWMKLKFPQAIHLSASALSSAASVHEAQERLGKTRPLINPEAEGSGRRGASPGFWRSWPFWGSACAILCLLGLRFFAAISPAQVQVPAQPQPQPPLPRIEATPEPTPTVPIPPKRSRPSRQTQSQRPAKSAEQESGTLDVQVLPWAEVSIGGKNYGITPLDPLMLPAGNYRVSLRNQELQRRRDVEVQIKAGKKSVVRANFYEPDP